MALQEAALADYDPSNQLWHWHATVAEYANSHFRLSEDERRAGLIALLSAWTKWLKRFPDGMGKMLFWMEEMRSNLEAEVAVCPMAKNEEAWAFLDALDAQLPSPDRTIMLREMVADVWEAKLKVLPADEEEKRAILLDNYGGALIALGQCEDALKLIQESLDIQRQLAQVNPQKFLPDLARILSNLGECYSRLGRREDALKMAEGAI